MPIDSESTHLTEANGSAVVTEPRRQLWRFFASLAGSVVATQQRLDAVHGPQLKAFEGSIAPLLVHLDPALVAPLAPPRQVVTEMSFSTEIDLTVDRSTGIALKVEPLGVGVARRFDASTATTSSLTVSVQAVPFPPNPSRRTP